MAKIQLKSDNITPFGGLYSIFNQFNRSGVRKTIDSFLGYRSRDPKAFSYGDVFASLFASYLCGGDCIEDVMDVKSFWNGHDGIRIASSDTIERTLRKLSCNIIFYYNQRGASERNFDCQNNDFGWAHLPFSYLKENTVFLLVTAMLKNFYLYILQTIGSAVKGLDITSRLKRFIHRFVCAPAKWIRSGRQEMLNI